MPEERTLPIHLALLFIVLLFSGVILYARHVTNSRAENVVTTSTPTELTTYVYAVNLEYPADWQPTPGYYYDRYNGADGFFQLSGAGDAKTDIEALVREDVTNALKPYGASPTTEKLQVGGQPAWLIMPSADQDASMHKQAELIVKYPKPVTISSHLYYYFVLQADADHIREIARSLTFI